MKVLYFSVLLLVNFSALSCCVRNDDPVDIFRKNISRTRLESVQWLPPLHSKVVTTIGIDEYYSYAHDFNEAKSTYYVSEDSRTKRTMMGATFKPIEFFKKPRNEQIPDIKGAILSCNLLEVIGKRRRTPIVTEKFAGCEVLPYSEKLEMQFEEMVWQILREKYDTSLSLADFQASLRETLLPQDAMYSAPLIAYYATMLAPRYECYYNTMLRKVIKRPSEFEVLTGTPDIGTVVYERKQGTFF